MTLAFVGYGSCWRWLPFAHAHGKWQLLTENITLARVQYNHFLDSLERSYRLLLYADRKILLCEEIHIETF